MRSTKLLGGEGENDHMMIVFILNHVVLHAKQSTVTHPCYQFHASIDLVDAKDEINGEIVLALLDCSSSLLIVFLVKFNTMIIIMMMTRIAQMFRVACGVYLWYFLDVVDMNEEYQPEYE